MKIINQTAEDLTLKEGNAKTIVIGTSVVLVGIGVMFYVHFIVSTPLWIAIGLCIIGLVAIFASSSISVDINKTNGQITYQVKRLIGGRTAIYAVGDVLRIEIRKSWRMYNGTRTGNLSHSPRQILIFQSVIVFKNGQELPLDRQNNSSGISIGPAVMMGGSGNEVAVANQIATFLGVPFLEIAPPNGPMGINIGGGSGAQF